MKPQYTKIVSFLKEYQNNHGCKGYVLGISGGKDSTIVARILCDAVGPENVFGVLMPNKKQKDIKDSIEVCKLLGIRYQEVNIGETYSALIRSIERGIRQKPDSTEVEHFANPIVGDPYKLTEKAKSNVAPRIRMTVLYVIAQSLGLRVCGTGNLSERFVGWFTKWGDGACDINPIAHLLCTEVIALGDYLELPEHLVHKTPADGITGKSDEENLGISYKDLDQCIKDPICADIPLDVRIKVEHLHDMASHKFAPLIIEDHDSNS